MGALSRRRRNVVLLVLCASAAPLFSGLAAASDASSETPMSTETMPADMNSRAASDQAELVTITGSRLRTAATQSAQDVHIYDLARIEQSGQSTVPDFLAT